MASTANDSFTWLESAYNSHARHCLEGMRAGSYQIKSAVDDFYNTLSNIPSVLKIIGNYSSDEFTALKNKQVEYLTEILLPQRSVEEHRQKALAVGYRHFHVGVPVDLLIEANILYIDLANTLVVNHSNSDQLKSIITRRLQFDLFMQIKAYVNAQLANMESCREIIRLDKQGSSLDYIQEVLASLFKTFGGSITGLAFGVVKNENYRHLLAVGDVPFDSKFIDKKDYPTVKLKEIERAWFDEYSYIENTLTENKEISTSLKEECHRHRITSFGFFLINDLQFAPKAYLLVCSKYTGYFLNENIQYYWQQIVHIVGSHFDFLERFNVKRQHRLSDGVYYRQLLARGKVQMFFQPIIDPDSGQAVKVEALARLVDGEKVISPGEFLPAFGANQLRDLFEKGLVSALEGLMSLPGKAPLCSINLPPEAFHDKEWLGELPNYLAQCGALPDTICLEMLESSLHDNNEIITQLYALREAGYSMLLDDVGTGESSLMRLLSLPISGIKIDQGFVRSLQNNFDTLDLILSLQFIALQRGLECIAEGVETESIIDAMCSTTGRRPLLQGYYFAKPMPASELVAWLKSNDKRSQVPRQPQSLYGWYARHIERLFTIRNALYSISDLISTEALQNAELCPLHEIIPDVGGTLEVTEAHYEWHRNYAKWTKMVQFGEDPHKLWQDMEKFRLRLQQVIEKNIKTNK